MFLHHSLLTKISLLTTELSPSIRVTLHALDVWSWNTSLVLQGSGPYPGDAELSRSILNPCRFKIEPADEWATMYAIRDSHLDFCIIIAGEHLQNEKFNIRRWYSKMLIQTYQCLEGKVFRLLSDNEYNIGCLYDSPMPAELADDIYEVDLIRHWTAGLQPHGFRFLKSAFSFWN